MDIKKEDPSKVIIVPRPPREMNAPLVPLEPAVKNPEAVDMEDGPASAPVAVAGPDFAPMNNQVEGPAQGLAGVPKPE